MSTSSDTFTLGPRSFWDTLFEDRPGRVRESLLLGFNGHFTPNPGNPFPLHRAEDVGAEQVNLFMRNYQSRHSYKSNGDICPGAGYGDGWNVIVVFDPEAGEIRIREYQIEDAQDDCSHDGVPLQTFNPLSDPDWKIRRTDYLKPAVHLDYSFPDARPASYDNCSDSLHDNPSQWDEDCDKTGNYCDCDFDQDGTCGIQDFNIFVEDYLASPPIDQNHTGTDMNADGFVTIQDFNLFNPLFIAGAPGPHGPDVVPPSWSWCSAGAAASGGTGAGAAMSSMSLEPKVLANTLENQPMIELLREVDPESRYLPQ